MTRLLDEKFQNPGGFAVSEAERAPAAPALDDAGIEPLGGGAARLAALMNRWKWPIVGVWLVLAAVAGISALQLPSVLSGGGWYVEGSQSKLAVDRLAQSGMLGRGRVPLTLVIHDRSHTADDPRFERRVQEVLRVVEDDPALGVAGYFGWSSLDPFSRAPFLGADRRTVVNALAIDRSDGDMRRELPDLQEQLTERFRAEQLEVTLLGPASFWGQVNRLSESDLVRAELVTFPLIGLILLLLFRSVVAVAVCLIASGTAIVLALGLLTPLAQQVELSIFVQNAATMLGLGVGVDYSLFMVSRFQEELRAGRAAPDAVTVMLHRAGHTVLFSGLTILITGCTLFLVELNVIFSLAVGAITVVAVAILVSVLLVPALLLIAGERIDRGRLRLPLRTRRASRAGRWHTLTMAVMRRPVLAGTVAILILVVLALPALGLRTFTPDARIIPQSSPVRQGYDLVQEQFGVGATSPISFVVSSTAPISGSGMFAVLERLHDEIRGLDHVVRVNSVVDVYRAASPARPITDLAQLPNPPASALAAEQYFVSPDRRMAVIEIQSDGKGADPGSVALVEQLRELAERAAGDGVRIVVGGETAENIDADAAISDRLGLVVAAMLVMIFVLLMTTFRSLLLPVKAVVLNVFSLAASYGVLVFLFQNESVARALGLEYVGYLQNFVPILLLALLFSLSTDYEVFLINRVREEYQKTGDNTAAVASGMEATGPLISGAAVLMVAVFGAFALTGMLPIQQLGLGLAVAILIDATIIRVILVPVTMRLAGRWNWWLPGDRPVGPAAGAEAVAGR